MHPTLDAKTHLNYPMSPDIGISGYPDTAPASRTRRGERGMRTPPFP